MFQPNRSLETTIMSVMRDQGHNLLERLRVRIALAFLSRDKRRQLEHELTTMASTAGAIPPQSVGSDGVYVGAWQDLFQWFLDNWESILELILRIISFF
jgi:hypothetical protein